MGLVDIEIDEHVAIVALNDGENRFNPDFLNAFLESLDQVEQQTPATTMVVKGNHDKIFSNGIDLEWLVPVIQQGDIEAAPLWAGQGVGLVKQQQAAADIVDQLVREARSAVQACA